MPCVRFGLTDLTRWVLSLKVTVFGNSVSMVILQVIFIVCLIYLHKNLANFCEVRHTKEPPYALQCLAPTAYSCYNVCEWRTVSISTTTPVTEQCQHELGQCESLQTAIEVMINAFATPYAPRTPLHPHTLWKIMDTIRCTDNKRLYLSIRLLYSSTFWVWGNRAFRSLASVRITWKHQIRNAISR